MDRFIDETRTPNLTRTSEFKIQYGQIYRPIIYCDGIQYSLFKIQYGQIYRPYTECELIIPYWFKIQYGQIYRKSNSEELLQMLSLKSNMDRFIVFTILLTKSNFYV